MYLWIKKSLLILFTRLPANMVLIKPLDVDSKRAPNIAGIELQKSNFGNYYQLLMKIFVQGMFGKAYAKQEVAKAGSGHINNGESQEYKSVFNLDTLMDDENRKEKLEELFSLIIVPFINKALSKSGIKELAAKGEIFLTPAVKEELG
jgi:hypothetical protein